MRFRDAREPYDLAAANCMIVMEIRFIRDALGHILDAVQPQTLVLDDRDTLKVRTISQLPAGFAFAIPRLYHPLPCLQF